MSQSNESKAAEETNKAAVKAGATAGAVAGAVVAETRDMGITGTARNLVNIPAICLIAAIAIWALYVLQSHFNDAMAAHRIAAERREAENRAAIKEVQDGYRDSLRRFWEEAKFEREANKTIQEKMREALHENTRAVQDLSRELRGFKHEATKNDFVRPSSKQKGNP